MDCPGCGAENAASRKFCRACGAALALLCPACAASNEPGDRFCGECGAALALPQPATVAASEPSPVSTPSLPEERRLVTALFADLVGFTSLSERLDSELVREIVTECLRRLAAEVERFEGTVDKFMGDSIMAIWGAPLAHEDDAARALRAALGMQRAVESFNLELQQSHGLSLALRIGVQTGEVVAGLRQVGEIVEYSINGDAVNVAARLQSAAAPGTVLVGADAVRLAGHGFELREMQPLELKNKERPVAASMLIGARSQPAPISGAPLVGREEELRQLQACLAELQRGRGQLVALVGEPGLGKSRLLAELRGSLPAEHAGAPPRWLRAAAFANEQSQSYGLARSLLLRLCDLTMEAPDELLSGRLAELLPAAGQAVAFPALARVFGLCSEPSTASELDPRELQRLAFVGIAALFEHLARDRPLLLELDDLHWADPTSIDLLLELGALTDRAPLMLCCAFRPERDTPVWALRERLGRDFHHRLTEVVLRPLSESASAELVTGLLRLTELPPGLRGLLERAAGTPLWVEELVRTLIDRGLLVEEAAGWRLTEDLARVELPASLQALIVARIDRLGEARPALQTAAVVGRRFERGLLSRVAGDDGRLDEHLLRAQRSDLIRELATIPDREYEFKHVLTQEAAYSTLLLRRRRELHGRVAESLEALYSDRLDELRALLIHHYEQAELWAKALEHARLAASAAIASYALREARAHLDRALAAAERQALPAGQRLPLYEQRAGVVAALGDFEPASQDYEAALELARRGGDTVAQVRLLGALGALWGGHKDYEHGLALTRQAAETAATLGDDRALADARARVGLMLLNLARMGEAQRELEAALALFRSAGDAAGQDRTLDLLSMVTVCGGQIERSVVYAREAIERLQASGDQPTAASTMGTLGVGLSYLGQRAEAEVWFRRALAFWSEVDVPAALSFTHWALAEIVEPYGDYELAWREATSALQIARQIGHREWIAGALSILGRVQRACGNPGAARTLHEEMLGTARELGTALWIAEALGELGQDLVALGDDLGATPLFAEAIASAAEAGKFTARARLGQAEQALSHGRSAEALEEVRQFNENSGELRVLALEARRIEGAALAALGQVAAGETILRETRQAAATIGAAPALLRTCLALGDLLQQTGRPDDAAREYAEALSILETLASALTDPTLREALLDSQPLQAARMALTRCSPDRR